MSFSILRKTGLFFVLAGAVFSGALAQEPDPAKAAADDLAARNDAVVRGLQSLRGGNNLSSESALALIQKEMSPIIDFPKLAASAAGKHWRRAKDDEKAAIIAAFQKLLENTYAKVLARYSDQAVRIAESKVRDDGKTEVGIEISDGDVAVKVDYVFHETDAGLRVVDIKVESVSLLANYRRQFAGIIKKSGTAGLAAALQKLAAPKK